MEELVKRPRNEAGEKILELAETEDGVICWIRGKKYVLQPVAEAGQAGGAA